MLIKELDECNRNLPEIASALLMKGVAIELMNGDSLSVKADWLKVLCCLQFLKNTKFVRIVLNHFEQLFNPILSAKKLEFCNGMTFCYLNSPFFLQCYKPQYDYFKIVFDL